MICSDIVASTVPTALLEVEQFRRIAVRSVTSRRASTDLGIVHILRTNKRSVLSVRIGPTLFTVYPRSPAGENRP